MKIFRGIFLSSLALAFLFLYSCGGNDAKIQELQQQNDSLALAAEEAEIRYTELSGYLSDISDCVDSVSMQENLVFLRADPETGRVFSRQEIRNRIENLGNLIERQRARIAALTDSLGVKRDSKEIQRLTQLVSYLNEQLAAKEHQLQQLQNELATSKRNIADLQATVTSAKAANEELKDENSTLDQMVVEKTNQLNQGYFIAKPKKELEKLGIVKGGNLFKKSKFDPGSLNVSECMPVDIRSFNDVSLDSKKKPVILSQVPASSYTIEENGKGKWKLYITDSMSFWSLSKILVIQLQ